jgi:hypothetical protein
MSEYEFTLAYERAGNETDHFSRERFQREVWDVLLDMFSGYLMQEPGIWTYLRDVTVGGRREGWWQAEDDVLRFRFPLYDGARVRSAAACAHWAELAAAARARTLESLADQSGARLTDAPSDLAERLAHPEELFVVHAGQTWLLQALDGGMRLVGDGEELRFDQLDETCRDEVEAMCEQSRCDCPICTRLRPDPQWQEAWRADLASGDRSRIERATSFLLQTVAPSTAAIVDLAAASIHRSAYRHTRAMFELGRRLAPSRIEDLALAVDREEDPRIKASLIACVAGLAVDPDVRTSVLVNHFEARSPAAETAVEFLGYGDVPRERRVEVAERLADRIGDRDDLDYAVALTLYNVFRQEEYPPAVVKGALRALADRSGEQADVARRALAWFDR